MNDLKKNILGIGASTILIRLVGVVQGIVLMRLIAPEVHGIFSAAIAALAVIAMLTEEPAVTPWIIANPEEAEPALSTLRTVAVLRGLLVASVLMLGAPLVAKLIGNEVDNGQISYALTVLATGIVVTSLQNPSMRKSEGEQNFKRIVVLEAAAQIIAVATGISVAWIFRDVHALLAAALVPHVVMTVGSYLLFPSTVGWSLDVGKLHAACAWGWPFWVIGLLTTVTTQFDDLFVNRLAGSETLGFYARAYFWSTTTSIVIMQAFTRALFPRVAANRKQHDRVREDFSRARRSILQILLILQGILFVLAEPFTLAVGGPEWLPMVPYFRIFLVLSVFRVMARLSGQFLGALGESRRLLPPKIFEASALVLFAWTAHSIHGAAGIAMLSTVLYGISWYWHQRLLMNRLDSPQQVS